MVHSGNPSLQPEWVEGQGYGGSDGVRINIGPYESYLYKSGLPSETEYYLSFNFNPAGAIIPDQGSWIPSKSIRIADIRGGPSWSVMVGLRVRKPDGQGYRAYLEWQSAAGLQYDYEAGEFDIDSDWQLITIGFKTDEWIAVWHNGLLKRKLLLIDHDPDNGSIIEIGKISINSSINPSGEMLFDNVQLMCPTISDLYVDADNGHDGNDGLTSATAFQTIQKAADLAGPGTNVHILPGLYNERVRPQLNGTVANPIVFLAEMGPGTVIVDGTGVDLPEWYGLFNLSERSYFRISGLHFQNSEWAGVFLSNSQGVVIEHNSTYNTTSSGIQVWYSTEVVIRNNDIRLACNGGSQECITVSGSSYFEVSGNEVHDGAGLEQGGEGIDIKGSSCFGHIFNNYIHDLPGEVGLYLDAYGSYNHDHEVSNNISTAPVGIALSAEAGGTLENVWLYNNLVYDCSADGIIVTSWIDNGPRRNIRIINNTVFNCGASGLGWYGGIHIQSTNVEQITIRNNISSQNDAYQIRVNSGALSNVLTEYNCIDGFRGYTDEIYGNYFLEGDPLFVDVVTRDLHVQADSICIDTGSAEAAPDYDFDGKSRPLDGNNSGTAEYDLGAFEWGESVITAPPTPGSKTNHTDQPMTGFKLVADGSQIRISWNNIICPAYEYTLVYGQLSSLSSYSELGCKSNIDPDVNGSYDWDSVPSSQVWFVVVGCSENGVESSWGTNSNSVERAGGPSSCSSFKNSSVSCP
ncbi:right-handed parallel beta-helix repeat-containing protein [bacterium]|nr:right-handed parallel beta-helix repeat-containing protein [bacterium]